MKKIIGLLLACLILLSALGTPALAASPSGSCGENLTWSLDEATGVLTVSGTGSMYDYQVSYQNVPYTTFFNSAPWWPYRLQVKKVVVEQGVTAVGNNAFRTDDVFAGELFYDNLTEVVLADSVASVGDYAFYGCELQTVRLGAGLRTIGELAFFCNQGLKEIALPNALTTIGDHAFEITGLTGVTIPASVTSIGERAFGYNTMLMGGTVASVNFTVTGYAGTAAEGYYRQLLQEYNNDRDMYGAYGDYAFNYPAGGTVYFNDLSAATAPDQAPTEDQPADDVVGGGTVTDRADAATREVMAAILGWLTAVSACVRGILGSLA